MLNTTLTEVSRESVEFSPTDSVSIYAVEGIFEGKVELQYRAPDSPNGWFTAVSTTKRSSDPILTPSNEFIYRFKFSGTGSSMVSFGPTV